MNDTKAIVATVVNGLEDRSRTKINVSIVAKLVDSLEKNPRIGLACNRARISKGTYFNWYRRWPEFAELMDEAQLVGVTEIEDKLFQSAMTGNVVAQIFLAKKWKPERYEDSITVNEPKRSVRYDPNKLSSEEQEVLERLSAKARILDEPDE